MFVFFFKQKTAYEMRISDWSSDVCSSDLIYDLWNGRRSDGDLVSLGDLSVTVYVQVFNVSTSIGAEVLRGSVQRFFVVDKQAFRDVSDRLTNGISYPVPPGLVIIWLFIYPVFAGCIGEITHGRQPETIHERLFVIQGNIGSRSGCLTNIRTDGGCEPHCNRDGCPVHQDVLSDL